MPAVSAALHLAHTCALPISPQNINTGYYLELYLVDTFLKTVLGIYRALLALSLVFFKSDTFWGEGKYCRNFCVTCFNLLQKKYRQKADALKFTSVADSSQIKHAKKSQELQSDVSP